MMTLRDTLGIDPLFTDRFFSSLSISTSDLLIEDPIAFLLPPDKPHELITFLSSTKGREYKSNAKKVIKKLKEILMIFSTPEHFIESLVLFENKYLQDIYDLSESETVAHKLYQEGIPALVCIVNEVRQNIMHPEKWLTPIKNLLREIEKTCSPGVHSYIMICLKTIRASNNLGRHLQLHREALVKEIINNILRKNSPGKMYEIHFINFIQNTYANTLGISQISDIYADSIPHYKGQKKLLDNYFNEFKKTVKLYLRSDIFILKLLQENDQLFELMNMALGASDTTYTDILKKINEALDFYGALPEQYHIQLRDLFLFNDNDKIIKIHWKAETILIWNILQRLQASQYIKTIDDILMIPTIGNIAKLPHQSLTLGHITPTYEFMKNNTFNPEDLNTIHSNARFVYVLTDDAMYFIDQLKSTCHIIAGIDEKKLAAENNGVFKNAKKTKMLAQLNLVKDIVNNHIQPDKIIDDIHQQLGISRESDMPLLVFMAQLYLDNYDLFIQVKTKLFLNAEQKKELDEAVAKHVLSQSFIIPHINYIGTLPANILATILQSLPHDNARHLFLDKAAISLYRKSYHPDAAYTILATFDDLPLPLIGSYLLTLTYDEKTDLLLQLISKIDGKKKIPITTPTELRNHLALFFDVAPNIIMQFFDIDPVALLEVQLMNNKTNNNPMVRLAPNHPNHLPLIYLKIALLTLFIQHQEVILEKLNDSIVEKYLAHAKHDLDLLLYGCSNLPKYSYATPISLQQPSFIILFCDYLASSNHKTLPTPSTALFFQQPNRYKKIAAKLINACLLSNDQTFYTKQVVKNG